MNMITVKEAHKISGKKLATIHCAIRKNRITSKIIEGKLHVNEYSVKEYFDTTYDRKYRCQTDGSKIYSLMEGRLCPQDCADILDCKKNHIYYLLKKNRLKHHKVGYSYVILKDDLLECAANKHPIRTQKKKRVHLGKLQRINCNDKRRREDTKKVLPAL